MGVDFVHQDKYDMGWEEKTTVCTIFDEDINKGTRKVFRQFIRTPDGCILEKFGGDIVDAQRGLSSGVRHKNRNTKGDGGYGVLLDAIAGGTVAQKQVESHAIGQRQLTEVADQQKKKTNKSRVKLKSNY